MKVVIVSTPRTCSGYLCNIFDKKFNLIDYSELFSDVWIKASPELKLKMVNKSDNRVENLEWVTNYENFSHSVLMGKQKHM